VFCGSSDAADPDFLADAARLGALMAEAGVRLVYGGGGVGLMGACARAAHEAGGQVLGIIPDFLVSRERAFDVVETVVVTSMHERKMRMFEESDGFIILPGGIGTLEEVVELLSWRRLDLHAKPVVFHNPKAYWSLLFDLFQHTIDQNLTPPSFLHAYSSVEAVKDILPALAQARRLPPDTAESATRLA
jgi:hypothetical protein